MAELEAFTVRLGVEDATQLRAAAEAGGVAVTEIQRQAIQAYLAQRAGDRVASALEAVVAKHTDRLAAMLTKVYVAAGCAAWEASALIGCVPDTDEAEVMKQSVVRAMYDWHQKGATSLGEGGEEAYTAAELRAGMSPR